MTVDSCEIGPIVCCRRLENEDSTMQLHFLFSCSLQFLVMAPLFMFFVLGGIPFPSSLRFFVLCICDLERDGSVLHWYQRTCT